MQKVSLTQTQIKQALKASTREQQMFQGGEKLMIDADKFESYLRDKLGVSDLQATLYSVQLDLQDDKRDRLLTFWTESDPPIYGLDQEDMQELLDKKYSDIANRFCKDAKACKADTHEKNS